MEEHYEIKYHQLEKDGWWFLARRDIILRLFTEIPKHSSILDIGCSGGVLLLDLAREGFSDTYGIDISKRAIQKCKDQGIENVKVADGRETGYQDGFFDIVIASDTLEHIHNEHKALGEWQRILKTGGIAIIFVPAHMFLWGKHDEINQHIKRYSKADFKNAVQKSGFEIARIGYWNFLLFFPVATTRIFQSFLLNKRKNTKDQLLSLNPSLNKFLIYLLKFENIFLKKFNFPVGVSVFIVGIKN